MSMSDKAGQSDDVKRRKGYVIRVVKVAETIPSGPI